MNDNTASREGSKRAPATISQRDLDDIDALLADIPDPELNEKYRRQLTAVAHRNALWQDRREKAYDDAVKHGYTDPSAYASAVASKSAVLDQGDRRRIAISKRTEVAGRKRRNKYALKIERASKSANKNLRRLPELDRQYLEIIGDADKGGYLANTALVVQKLKNKLKAYKLPHWDKTTPALKVMAMCVECHKAGAITINLRVNADVCRKALKSPRGPASYMQDAIRRSFEKTFGKGNVPLFMIVIETTRSDGFRANGGELTSFHIHGAVVIPEILQATELIDLALKEAGGEWMAARGHSLQQRSDPLLHPYKWAAYMMKDVLGTSRHIDRKLFARSEALLKQAKASWDELREILPQTA